MARLCNLSAVLLIISFTNIGCLGMFKVNVAADDDKSALEIRSVQLRDIEGEYKTTFRAVMDVLQDMGFTIVQTNMETGHVVAIKKILITVTIRLLFSTRQHKTFVPQEATVTMEKWGEGVTRVRVNTDLGKVEGGVHLNAADRAKYLDPEKFYEEFFANLRKAVFLRKEKI
ncbi:MAG TPA: hypothetical protein ENI77_11095 [Nitrospirae bacterium]|nr:hypothetical protein [Nitrospirota bacterium]